jgi:hypothetical protein
MVGYAELPATRKLRLWYLCAQSAHEGVSHAAGAFYYSTPHESYYTDPTKAFWTVCFTD